MGRIKGGPPGPPPDAPDDAGDQEKLEAREPLAAHLDPDISIWDEPDAETLGFGTLVGMVPAPSVAPATAAAVLVHPVAPPPLPQTPAPDAPPDLIPGILPAGEIHLFSGASGAGKTCLMVSLIAAAQSGSRFLGLEIRRPSYIGAIFSDRPAKDHAKWFAAAGIDQVPSYSLIDDRALSGNKLRNARRDRFKLFLDSVHKLCPRLPADSLILVDPISLFLGGSFLDYDAVYTHLFDLNQFCVRNAVTIIGLAHASKQKSDPKQRYGRPQDRIAGTTAQTGCAGTTLHLAPPNETDEEWYEFTWVPHHAPSDLVKLTRHPSTGLFEEASATIPTRRERKAVVNAVRLVPCFPQDGAEIHHTALLERAEVLGISRATAHRYLAQLSADGLATKGTKRGFWRLSQNPPIPS